MAVLAKNLWSLFKLRISLAIMLCALAGIAVAPGPALTGWQMALLSFAVLLSAASAGAFNHYVECDLDARMPRTRDRPFVTGYFHRGPAWLSVASAPRPWLPPSDPPKVSSRRALGKCFLSWAFTPSE